MSFFNDANSATSPWKNYEKALLRFFFLYFVIQVVPLDWKFYKSIFSINWSALSFYDLFKLTTYSPQFFSLSGFSNWAIAAAIALIGTIIWPFILKKDYDDNKLYYWLRVILRYRLAIGIIFMISISS